MDAQKQIRDNTQELHDFIKDLQDWEKSVKNKDSCLKTQASSQNKQIPPVRKLGTQVASTKSQNAAEHTYDYFKDKWDKFDVEAALKEVDEEPRKEKAPETGKPMDAVPMEEPETSTSEAAQLSSDAVPDATLEKDRGNEYFKEKKYVQAVECYSRSIALYPTAVAYANRAMALLKIRRYEDAEADCSEAIALDDRYTKAYARRGTARKERNKLLGAVEDFEFALRLEPNNKELQKQYQESKTLYEKKNPYRPAQTKVSLAVQNPVAQRESSATTESMVPALITSTTVDEQNIPVKTADEQSPSLSTSDAGSLNGKSTEVTSKKQELSSTVQAAATRAAATAMSAVAQNMVPPKTSYEFEMLWRGFGTDYEAKSRLIKLVDPSMLPKIFRDALGASLLLDILKTLELLLGRDASEFILEVLDNLTKVGRFSMTLMCLSKEDKSVVRQLFDKVSVLDNNVSVEKLELLRKKYKAASI